MKKLIAIAMLGAALVARADTFPEGTENIPAQVAQKEYSESDRVRVYQDITLNVETTDLLGSVRDFLGSATTNLIVVAYGIASTDFTKFGGGVALGYQLSPNVVPFMRIENYNGDFFMPSGTVQLQVPFHLGSWTVVPLAYTGVAVPIGKHINDPVVGIVGTGAAIRLGSKFDFLAAYEMRNGVGNQICLGIGWKPLGWL